MKARKTKRVTIASRGSNRKSNSTTDGSGDARGTGGTRSAGRSTPRGRAKSAARTSGVRFDAHGRLIVQDRKIARRILDAVEGTAPLSVITLPGIRDPRPPNPADAMCGCNLIKLKLVSLVKIENASVRR